MAKIIMRADGMNGQIELMNDRVIVRRAGFLNGLKYGFNAKREIPLAAISEVMFNDATTFRMGEIEFIRGGRSTEERKKLVDCVVKFKKKDQQQFETLKEKVFELMQQQARR